MIRVMGIANLFLGVMAGFSALLSVLIYGVTICVISLRIKADFGYKKMPHSDPRGV